MNTELHYVSVSEIAEKYADDGKGSVFGCGGRLNIRPAYHREFFYDAKRRDAVVRTVLGGRSLGEMHWLKCGGGFEMLDGQQRTVSLCRYVAGRFAVNRRKFHDLSETKRKRFLGYRLPVRFCESDEKEKLEWFNTLNLAGERLTPQELRNAAVPGPWLTDARARFSRRGGPAHRLGRDFLTGDPARQDYLEAALNWFSFGNIEVYMEGHRFDADAGELFDYFRKVMHWVRETFPVRREAMRGVAWGMLYDEFFALFPDPDLLEREVASLMADDLVTDKRGIYRLVLEKEAERTRFYR